ncbi:MAG: hypothetical protein HND47_03175 [Chloroflexi bacterium]|nr:hypothetical protein [Chloroflexota bacterium]
MEEQRNNLEKQILEWLKTQGYPLELEVALAFQKEGFSVFSSDWYEDYETGELREIDVTALKWSDTSKPRHLQVCYRIECKTSREKPWVVFKSDSESANFSPFLLMATDNYKWLWCMKG